MRKPLLISALIGACALLALPFTAMAIPTWTHSCTDTQTTCEPNAHEQTNANTGGDMKVDGNLFTSGSLVVQGGVSVTTSTGSANAGFIAVAANVALTTASAATAQFSATGQYYISLSTNANVTGVRPTNGTTGQQLIIRSANGQGTNTMRFDDNASTVSLGGNITLTEGNNDVLALVCTTGGTGTRSQWARLYSSAN